MSRPKRLTYSHVMSTAAVFIALGGTSYAATQITSSDVKNGSLTGTDIKNSSLTGADIKSGSLTGSDIKSGSIKSADLAPSVLSATQSGATGATGATGPKGDTGAQGPKGDAGSQGPKGDAGSQGPKGDAGPAGASGVTRVAQIRLAGGPLTIPAGATVSVPLSGATWTGTASEVISAYSYGFTRTARNPCTKVTGASNPDQTSWYLNVGLAGVQFLGGGEDTSNGPLSATTMSDTAFANAGFLLPTAGTRNVTATVSNFCQEGPITLSALGVDVYRLAGE